jgi:4-diphosphocytidyl-2-C-methyl-D-erythritol kinase
MRNESYVFHSSAKVNLTLDVLSLRADGYHELQSVVHTIGLWDELRFDFSGSPGLRFSCNREELVGEGNLCLKAARSWLQASSWLDEKRSDFPSIHIALQKNIPTGAGLGGGSGNAAATLIALQTRFPNRVSTQALHEIAAKLGADVPLFLSGGCMVMEGIGEKLSPLPNIEAWLVVLQPPGEMSTPHVYRAWDKLQKPSAKASQNLIKKLNAQPNGVSASVLANALQNDLSLPATNLGLNIAPIVQLLRDAGALDAQMTGSGSAVFGVFADEIAARNALQIVQQRASSQNLELRFANVAPFCDMGVRHGC